MTLTEAVAEAREAAPGPTVQPNSQDWAGMDGTTAYHLIQRHADNWSDIGLMMGEWLAANVQPAVLEERERCAAVCEELIAWNEDDPGETAANHIRLGAEPGEWINDHCARAAAISAPT